jgi:hypothetical protein
MLFGLLVLAVTTGAQAGSARLPDNFWLLGNFTQNVRCRGNSSDPAEVKVKVAADQIVSKVGICKFVAAAPERNRLNATMQCEFPAGPLIGDVTFTQRTNGTIDVVDRDKTFTGTLYRCPN